MNKPIGSYLSTVFVAILFLNGCIMTMPASESMMFNRASSKSENPDPLHGDEGQKHHEISAPFIFPDLSDGSLLFAARPTLSRELPYVKKKFDDYLQERYQEPNVSGEDAVKISNSNYVSFAASFPLKHSDKLGLNFSVGIPVLGIDATTRLYNNTYATMNLGYLTGEFILQQKLIDRPTFGLSLGPYYRAERRGLHVVEGPDESFGISTIITSIDPAKYFYNHYIGLRSVFHIRLSSQAYIYAFTAPGYVANLKTVTANAGLAITF